MEMYLDLLLIRFGLIVVAAVVLALIAFAFAMSLKRRGKVDEVRRRLAPMAQGLAGYIERRDAGRPSLRAVAVRAAANRLTKGDK